MNKKLVDRVLFFLLGGVVATGALAYDAEQDAKEQAEALKAAIDRGDFDSEKASDITAEELEDVYFVGCNGFF